MVDPSLALVLSLHQPPGNLENLLEDDEQQAKEILWAMDRIPRSMRPNEDVARLHLSLSGTLLEALSSPDFQRRVDGLVDCGSLLRDLQNSPVIDVLGTAYYHPVLPLTPPADWVEHVERWQRIGARLFDRNRFDGFWPPEMGFCMDLIPMLRRLGYSYVLVDSEHVEPITSMRWEEIRYRPHLARFGGEEIVVVVRDREMSKAQEAGMEVDWFLSELADRTKHCDFPPLVTTCTDGENGAWFRDTSAGGNFWGGFHAELMERVRAGQANGLRPAFVTEYLDRHGAHGEVKVGPGTWNTGSHQGSGFVQWTGSSSQREALTRVGEMSQAVHLASRNAIGVGATDPELYSTLGQALGRVLRAETSCNFFWGEPWVQRCHDDLDEAARQLELAWTRLSEG
jgi:4-alpha-glucanotransferase